MQTTQHPDPRRHGRRHSARLQAAGGRRRVELRRPDRRTRGQAPAQGSRRGDLIDQRDYVTFFPSLSGALRKARADDITFPLAPITAGGASASARDRAGRFDLERKVVETDQGDVAYDRLVIATGPRLAFERIPGLGRTGAIRSRCARSTTRSRRARPGSATCRSRPGRDRYGSGRLVLRSVVRVPAEHPPPAAEGGPRRPAGNVRHLRALPRPLRARRRRGLRAPRRAAVRAARDRGIPNTTIDS